MRIIFVLRYIDTVCCRCHYHVKQVTPVTYKVRDNNNTLVKNPVHVNRMKPFTYREDRPIGPPAGNPEETILSEGEISKDVFDS